MNRSSFAFVAILVLLSSQCFSQARKSKKKVEPVQQENTAPTSLRPFEPETTYAPKKTKKSRSSKITYDQQQQYYDRVVAVAKQREKTEKIMQKPQYSNPMYFGHKKMPKKRSPKKMRYCKECGIRH